MHHVAVDDVPSNSALDAEKRELGDALETTALALNYFSFAPGEWASGLHAHLDQEEVYVVLSGTLTVETLAGQSKLETDEAVRFAPGEYHGIRNDGDDVARFLALGAPKPSDEVRIPLACPACDHDGLAPAMGDDGPVLRCPDCGADADAACPDCGGDDVRATTVGDGARVVGVCRDCGAASTP